jgi:hypothetical protein
MVDRRYHMCAISQAEDWHLPSRALYDLQDMRGLDKLSFGGGDLCAEEEGSSHVVSGIRI